MSAYLLGPRLPRRVLCWVSGELRTGQARQAPGSIGERRQTVPDTG